MADLLELVLQLLEVVCDMLDLLRIWRLALCLVGSVAFCFALHSCLDSQKLGGWLMALSLLLGTTTGVVWERSARR